jgi:hypothetical protein
VDERHEVLPSEEIKRRTAEKAALVAELEARTTRPIGLPGQTKATTPAQATRITADGRTLAGLTTRARILEARATIADEKAAAARLEAKDARSALEAYMRENGLL